MCQEQVQNILADNGELRLPELFELADSSPTAVFLATRKLYHEGVIERTGPGTYASADAGSDSDENTGFQWNTHLEE